MKKCALSTKVCEVMKRYVSTICLLWSVLVVMAGVYSPTTLPNPKSTDRHNYVCNPDGIVTDTDQRYLNQCADSLEQITGVELCVVAVESIGEMDAFDFCYELFQRWGIGKEGKNTGVLLFVATTSRDVRIMTGGGIEGILTDAVCNRIIQQSMLAGLKKGDYSQALCAGALHIYEICTDGEAPEELRNAASVTNRYGYADTDVDTGWSDVGIWFFIAFLLGGLALLMWLAIRPKRCPRCGQRELRKTSSRIVRAASYTHAGAGIYTYRCNACGYEQEQNFIIPKKTRSYTSGGSGGGFGGGFSSGSFGGGSTFGGGAGGKF